MEYKISERLYMENKNFAIQAVRMNMNIVLYCIGNFNM